MSVQAEFHSTLCRKYRALCISVRQPITEVKAEWNVAADVREIDLQRGFEKCYMYYDVMIYTEFSREIEPYNEIQLFPLYISGDSDLSYSMY